MPDLIHAFPSILAAFMASLVEFVEALTVVLAVAMTRGWRGALTGSALGLALLAILVIGFGPALTRIPLTLVQLVVGVLLLLFGLRWLRKAIQWRAEQPAHGVFQHEADDHGGHGGDK